MDIKNSKLIFKASYDTVTKIVTPIALLVLSFSIFAPLLFGATSNIVYYIVIPIIVVVTFGSIAFAPRYYSITSAQIQIHRMMLKPVIVSITNLQQVSVINKAELRGSLRLFGSGAFLGYFGWFASKKFGRAIWYATRLDKALLIYTKGGKKFLISPDDIDGFIQHLPDTKFKKAA